MNQLAKSECSFSVCHTRYSKDLKHNYRLETLDLQKSSKDCVPLCNSFMSMMRPCGTMLSPNGFHNNSAE